MAKLPARADRRAVSCRAMIGASARPTARGGDLFRSGGDHQERQGRRGLIIPFGHDGGTTLKP